MKRKKKVERFEKLLKKYIRNKTYVKIYRTGKDGSAHIYGFILDMSKEFLLVQNEDEFRLDGYAIIRLDQFDAIKVSENEVVIKKILKSERIIEKEYGIKNHININSFRDIFFALKAQDYFVIIECENLKKPRFSIGEISKIQDDKVKIKNFTSKAVIEKKKHTIKYKDITLIKFDQRYINVYRKYLVN